MAASDSTYDPLNFAADEATVRGADSPLRVAECHGRDAAAIRAAAERWWPGVPCASAAEIIHALRHVGLEARVAGPDHAILVRGEEPIVIVPLQDPVHPVIVRTMLEVIGITPEQLASYLAEP